MAIPLSEASFGVIFGSSLQLKTSEPDRQRSLRNHQQQGQQEGKKISGPKRAEKNLKFLFQKRNTGDGHFDGANLEQLD